LAAQPGIATIDFTMQKSSSECAMAQTVARFHWAIACERLDFALVPHDALPGMPPVDFETAMRLIEKALAEIRDAFGPVNSVNPVNPLLPAPAPLRI
jgi:hypothetical protein